MTGKDMEPLDEVLRQYDMEVLSIRNESYKDKKGVWWIRTPAGYKILKKVSNSEETLRYILHAVRHLTQNGIFIPHTNITRTGEEYANVGGSCYVLWDAVDGRNPSYDIPDQLAIVVRELARFHKASAGFVPLPGSKAKIHLGTWPQDYAEQLEDMNRFHQKILANSERSEIEKWIVQEFPLFYTRGMEAVHGLQGPEYKSWCEKAEKQGCLCHQDFAAGNLFLSPSGRLHIIDTDSITIDIPARDLRKLLNKIMKKKNRWDPDLTRKVLSLYQSVNPLTQEEWDVLRLDLKFPHLFIGAMNKYCYKREKDWTEATYFKRLKEVSAIEKTIQPILDAFGTIQPKSS